MQIHWHGYVRSLLRVQRKTAPSHGSGTRASAIQDTGTIGIGLPHIATYFREFQSCQVVLPALYRAMVPLNRHYSPFFASNDCGKRISGA